MDINSVAILDKYYFSIILLSLWIFIYNISDLYHVLDCHNFFASKLCITMASLIRSFAFSISLDKNKCVSTSFTLSGIGASSLAKIFFFTSANFAFSSRSSLPSHNSSSVALVASLFSSLIIQSSWIPSLFTIHKLCNTIHIDIIYDIFLNNISDHFIINLHLTFNVPNALSKHICSRRLYEISVSHTMQSYLILVCNFISF